jgi:hypothetical protein
MVLRPGEDGVRGEFGTVIGKNEVLEPVIRNSEPSELQCLPHNPTQLPNSI